MKVFRFSMMSVVTAGLLSVAATPARAAGETGVLSLEADTSPEPKPRAQPNLRPVEQQTPDTSFDPVPDPERNAPAPTRENRPRKTFRASERETPTLSPSKASADGTTRFSLEQLENLALSRNPEIESMRAEARSHEYRRRSNLVRLFPDVNFLANYNLYNGGLNSTIGSFNGGINFLGISARQAIYDGGAAFARYSIEQAEVGKAKAREEELRYELRLQLIPLYYRAVTAQLRYETAVFYQQRLEQVSQRATRFLKAQVIGAPEARRINAVLTGWKNETEQALLRRDDTHAALRRVVNMATNETVTVDGDYNETLSLPQRDFTPSQAPLGRLREDARILRYREAASIAGAYPQISVFGTYGWRYGTVGTLFNGQTQSVASAGVFMIIPLSEALATSVGYREHQEDYLRNTIQQRQVQRDLQNRIDSLRRQVEYLQPSVRRLAVDYQASRDEVKKVEQWLKNGDVAPIGWLEAAVAQKRIEHQYLELSEDYHAARALLLALTNK